MRTVWRPTDLDLDRQRIVPGSTAILTPEMPDADVNDNTEKLLKRMTKTMSERERPRSAVQGVEGSCAQGQGCAQGLGVERSLRKELERARLVPVLEESLGEEPERSVGGLDDLRGQTRLQGPSRRLSQGPSQDPSQRLSQRQSQGPSQRQCPGSSQEPIQSQSQEPSQDPSQRLSQGPSQELSRRQSQGLSRGHGQSEVPSQSHGVSRSRSRGGVQGASCTVELDRSRNAVIVLSSWPRQDQLEDQQDHQEDQRDQQEEQGERTAGTGAEDMELERLSSDPGMVVESHQGYGSFPSPSSNVNGRPGTSGRADIMEESDTYLQSRPLLHDEADWRTAPHGDGDRDGQEQASNGGFGYQTAANGAAKADDSVRVNIGVPTSPRFPKEKLKTLLAMLWMVFNFILTLTSLAITHERVPETPPLPDVVLDTVPTGAWALQVSEITIMVLVNSAFIVVVLHRHRFIVFRRIFLIMGLLYMMRSLLYFVTALPKPDENYKCEPKAGYLSFALVASRVLKLFGGFGLSINGQHVYCGDYIYSGHTVTLTMAYLVLREYTPRHWWPLHGAALLAAATGVVMVLVARGHYTVDVLIAYYVTTRLFWMYHTLANNSALKEGGANNYLSRIWWFPMFRYFERNVSGPVPRRFEWPLPWPRCLLSKRPDRTS